MMIYVLICVSLSLAGVAGLQFFYMVYLERIDRERKKRIDQLERRASYLSRRLDEAENQLNDQNNLLETVYHELEKTVIEEEEEVWADVIEEK